jgi:hypothetical protein
MGVCVSFDVTGTISNHCLASGAIRTHRGNKGKDGN